MASAPFNLDRFLAAQAPVYAQVLDELRAGHKTSHWMWFVLPQLKGLGRSEMAQYYGLDGLAEATAYLQHPVLGERLRECTASVNALTGVTADQVFGMPDTLKFRSCMTLFDLVAGTGSEFSRALEQYFGGERDERTLSLVASASSRRDTR
jgi:uncharacterized protein (DUF1810 family)